MSQTIYDVIVIGTGAGGGMAIKTLCDAGAKVCALNGEPPPRSQERLPQSPPALGYEVPRLRGSEDTRQSIGYMDNEYTEGIWEHAIAYTTAPGTEWTWRRCFAVGGKTNFWGRSSARFATIDFQAATRDGYDVDWPITYDEIAPLLYARRAHDRRGQHASEPAQQSRRRISAAHELPLHGPHSCRAARTRSASPTCPTASRS